ncbi:hypothetical protein [Roseobacter fucihabitans]|uniref:hypothetical protein n=1 Tax=Roseobacter fucihabitans TaxID=1537242 RepID=UPI00165339C8|nr:hypothetical protein [Roseobacter litoralis]
MKAEKTQFRDGTAIDPLCTLTDPTCAQGIIHADLCLCTERNLSDQACQKSGVSAQDDRNPGTPFAMHKLPDEGRRL